MAEAMELIRAERRRQIDVEGWSPEHDAQHEPGHLLRAAVIYLWHGTEKAAPIADNGAPLSWPWEPEWWKPKDRRSNLIRAGALCMAERDAIKDRHRARVESRRRTIEAGKSMFRFFGGPPNTEHVEHKLQIVIRELNALERG